MIARIENQNQKLIESYVREKTAKRDGNKQVGRTTAASSEASSMGSTWAEAQSLLDSLLTSHIGWGNWLELLSTFPHPILIQMHLIIISEVSKNETDFPITRRLLSN